MTVKERWEAGIPHHPKSLALLERLVKVDEIANDNYFDWRIGGDGDNGEALMYELDIVF